MAMQLTATQKLHAMAHRFYSRQPWTPQPGDFYTSSRADLELYKVVDVRDGKVLTTYLPEGGTVAEWPADEFLADHTFGYARVHVPAWVFKI
jgi:hypothetical protein